MFEFLGPHPKLYFLFAFGGFGLGALFLNRLHDKKRFPALNVTGMIVSIIYIIVTFVGMRSAGDHANRLYKAELRRESHMLEQTAKHYKITNLRYVDFDGANVRYDRGQLTCVAPYDYRYNYKHKIEVIEVIYTSDESCGVRNNQNN